jgi:pyruvate-formate lyase-activating enzyme
MGAKGIIFDVKKYSIHDGPGTRTTAHLKGCPLSCWWCHNPESQAMRPAVLFRPERCIACGSCIEACPNHAISVMQAARSLRTKLSARAAAHVPAAVRRRRARYAAENTPSMS